jgi:hypothetical protein
MVALSRPCLHLYGYSFTLVVNNPASQDDTLQQELTVTLSDVLLLQGACIGNVFVSTGKIHHDRRIPLPGFDKQVSSERMVGASLQQYACCRLHVSIGCATGAHVVWVASVSSCPIVVGLSGSRYQRVQPGDNR